MEHWQWFIPCYGALCIIFVYLDYKTKSKIVKLTLKCSPLLMLMLAVTKNLIVSSASTSPSAPGSTNKLYQLFWGLLFSVFGDAYLVFSNTFLLGVVSFAIAQGIYVSMFGGELALFQGASNIEMIIGIIVISISCTVYVSIVSHMKPLLAVLAALYCVLISTMLCTALIQAYRSATYPTIAGATGAALFYLSDMMLSVNKWGVKFLYAQVLIMTTYYCAQLFIAASVLVVT
ncbi:Lysoplasmalogenase-like protein TMEM86A [Geodia barretti]|uniref:lysoplasmalogenase n=2 Tax=Geodia barretti TaxID=519541 RepID=A0AA35S7X8_GEOBA|nr:Lysoplasmalogenase-like protein TMEM86A [Geodia barretti]